MQRLFRIREQGKVKEVGRRTMATVPGTESLECKMALIQALIPLPSVPIYLRHRPPLSLV
jgi:hypothetical protein